MGKEAARSLASAKEQAKEQAEASLAAGLPRVFPIGSVYMTVAKTNPAVLLDYGIWKERPLVVEGEKPLMGEKPLVVVGLYVWERIA